MPALTILLVDNDPDFLKTRAIYLRKAGYEVVLAESPDEARRCLQERHIQIAILDIRLINDDDDKDESGLDLAAEAAFSAIVKIIITKRPSTARVKRALSPGFDHPAPAVDFVDKRDGPEEMIQAVERAYAQYIQPVQQMQIGWCSETAANRNPAPGSFTQLAAWLEPQAPAAQLERDAAELQDLFRKLFGADCQALRIDRLLWQKDQRAALEVYGFKEQDQLQYVVTCGPLEKVRAEIERYKDLAPQSFKTSPARQEETAHLAAVAWELDNAHLDQLQPLATLIQERSSPRQAIQNLVASLVSWRHAPAGDASPSPSWLARPTTEEHAQKIWQAAGELAQEALKRGWLSGCDFSPQALSLTLRGSNKPIRLENPAGYLDPAVLASEAGEAACLSPGELDPATILVDPSGETWLTDFAAAGSAPAWYDFACLEAGLHFGFAVDPDLWGVYEDAGHYLTAARLEKSLDQPEAGGRKIAAAIQEIRKAAAKMSGSDPYAYYLGLLYLCLDGLTVYATARNHTPAELRAALQRILFASRLVPLIARVDEMEFSGPAGKGELAPLRLDENGEGVWIGDRLRQLTPGNLKLLQLFLSQPERILSKEVLLRHLHPEDVNLSGGESVITSAIHRLRLALGDRRYIRNQRAKGYKLVTAQENAAQGSAA